MSCNIVLISVSKAPLYKFAWGVSDKDSYNDFGQNEARDGDRTDGYYHVALPDGRIQRVTYYVGGDSGYVAQVAYEGEARYDVAPVVKQRSSYSAAPVVYAAPAPVPVVYRQAAPSYVVERPRSSYGQQGRRVHVTHASPGAGGRSSEE